MNVYRYHASTKELSGKKVTINDSYVLQTGETSVVPPAPAQFQIPVYDPDLNTWSLAPDYRRVTFYRKSDRQPVRLSAIGQTPDSTLTLAKPSDPLMTWSEELNKWILGLAAVKAKKIQELYRQCDEKLNEVLSIYPKIEPETWSEKTRQSEIWMTMSSEQKSGVLADPVRRLLFAMLFSEAVGTHMPTLEQVPHIDGLAQRIMMNKTGFGVYTGLILKLKTDAMRGITEATTINEVVNIQVDFSAITLESIFAAIMG